jgi:hypothetical protein
VSWSKREPRVIVGDGRGCPVDQVWVEAARGPVGIAVVVGDTVGIVGDKFGGARTRGGPPRGPESGRRSEKEPPRPPFNPPREGWLYPRGPEGGNNVGLSARVAVAAVTGPIEGTDGGDLAGAVKFRTALGPVGARRADGPRGGDLTGGERRSSLDRFGLAGDRSLGVNLSLYEKGDGSCVLCESKLCRSSREGGCVKAVRLGCIGGDERRELFPDVLPE